jgi:drug/metabolite transporter (DMT)-like permease
MAAAASPGGLRVSRREAAGAALVGVLLTFGGNGLVTLAERHIASSLAALLIASEPFVIVLLGAMIGERVSRGTLIGVTVGFAGVTILVLPGASAGGSGLVGALLVLGASVSWGVGSISSTRVRLPPDLGVSTSLQMIFGGGVMLVAGLIGGEAGRLDVSGFSTESIVAFGYLVVFGSIVAFSAYTWLLQHVEISRVSTYAYVNPMIAVLLGWIVLGESISLTTLIGASVIVGSVAFTIRSTRPAGAPERRGAPDRSMVATARRRV